ESNEGAIDKDLEAKMTLAQQISSLVHSLRKKHLIKVRQPLSRILIPILNEKTRDQVQAVEDLILSEVNVKWIEYIDDTSGVLVKKIKPNFRKLGQQFGPKMKLIAAAINNFGNNEIAVLEKGGNVEVKIEEETVPLTLDDVEITSEDIP